MTVERLYKLIKYNELNKDYIKMTFKCIDCGEFIEKTINKNKVNVVVCKNCKDRFVIVPKEISKYTGRLIDYYVIKYNWYYKTIKSWLDKNNKLRDLEKKELDKLKLKYIINILSKDKGGK